MAEETQAKAATDTTTAETQSVDLNPQSQHAALQAQLADPNWNPAGATAAKEPETVTEEPPAGEQSQETTEETTTEAEPVAVEESEEEEEQPKKETDRFRFKDPADRRFAVLRKEGVAPDEAARIAYGIGNKAEADPTPEPEPEDPLVALRQQLVELDEKLAPFDEELPTKESRQLLQQRAELAADIRVETKLREREQQQTARSQHDAAAKAKQSQKEVATKAIERFPGIAEKDSAMRKEVDRLFAEYQGSAFLSKPEAPQLLAEQAAANVARVNSQKNGTNFETELAKLDRTAMNKPAPVTTTDPKPKPVAKAPVKGGNTGTSRPDAPATGTDKWKPESLDPKKEHEHLSKLIYGT